MEYLFLWHSLRKEKDAEELTWDQRTDPDRLENGAQTRQVRHARVEHGDGRLEVVQRLAQRVDAAVVHGDR